MVTKVFSNLHSCGNSIMCDDVHKDLPITLWSSSSDETFVFDLAKEPAWLIGGATGQGKTNFLHTIIVSLLYQKRPKDIKFILIDTKGYEFTIYNQIGKQYISDIADNRVITEFNEACYVIEKISLEIDNRYQLLRGMGVKSIKEYNAKVEESKRLPYLITIIDEYANLVITDKRTEQLILRIAQLGNQAGMITVLSTQYLTYNVISGTLRANFSGRVAFRTATQVDSRMIIDWLGAEELKGNGDMLITISQKLIHTQCPYVEETDIKRVTELTNH